MFKNAIWAGVAVVILAWAAWTAFLIKIGSYPPDRDTFAWTGSFGDSYGGISSLLSALAVAAALASIAHQRSSFERQQFESNFYILLGNLRSLLDAHIVTISGKTEFKALSDRINYPRLKRSLRKEKLQRNGRRAVRLTVFRIRDLVGVEGFRDSKIVHRHYKLTVETNPQLFSYFRLSYHICHLICQRPKTDRLLYARIFRAHLSNEEMTILAYNLSVGEGRFKFKKLAKDLSLLHNLKSYDLDDYEEAELKFFIHNLGEDCFNFDPLDLNEFKYT